MTSSEAVTAFYWSWQKSNDMFSSSSEVNDSFMKKIIMSMCHSINWHNVQKLTCLCGSTSICFLDYVAVL